MATAVVDTGANMTTLTERLASRLGIGDKANRGAMKGIGGLVPAYGGRAKVCMPDRGCGCLVGPVVIVGTKDFGKAQVLVGQDYLEASRAIIDAAGRTVRCRLRRR